MIWISHADILDRRNQSPVREEEEELSLSSPSSDGDSR